MPPGWTAGLRPRPAPQELFKDPAKLQQILEENPALMSVLKSRLLGK